VFNITDEGAVSLTDIEMIFLHVMGVVLSDLMAETLEELDARILGRRDKTRYELVDIRSRIIETVLGQPVTFKRRYYRDRETGEYVFLLDQQIGLDRMTRTSPALHDLMIRAGTMEASYRVAAENLARIVGSRITTHETIRQYVLKAGRLSDSLDEELIEKADGKRKVDMLFIEADGIWMHLQRAKKRSIEEKLMTVYEGWVPREGNPSEFSLKNSSMWSSHEQAEDWWDRASRWVYGKYDIDPDTTVVLGGDRASWIRQGTRYFGGKHVLYQVDRFHFTRDIRRIFGKDSEAAAKVMSAVDQDPTGQLLMRSLAEARPFALSHKRKDLDALISDLSTIPDCVCDYRVRLRAVGMDTSGLRGLGIAESQVNRVSNRTKKQGRSWATRGLKGIMSMQCARFSGNLNRVLKLMPNSAKVPSISKAEASKVATQVIHAVFESWPRRQGLHPPIMDSGRTASGGMSHLFHQLLNGA
jgi:hypothetical protein